MPNQNHWWSPEEITDIIAMPKEDFLAKYPDISYDAWRVRRGAELRKIESSTSARFTGEGQYTIDPWEYGPRGPMTKVIEKHVILSDIHGPYVHRDAFRVVLDFIRDFKPTHIDLLGDVTDMWEVSRYTKDPTRKLYLGREVAFTVDVILSELRAAAPKAQIIWVKGNHEARLQTYLWTRAPELASLPHLDMRHLFELDRFKIEYSDHFIEVGDVLMTHGHLARKGSGNTARAMLSEYGRSVVHGHTHRMGAIYQVAAGKTFLAFENGCLCEMNPSFLQPGTVNWSHGFSIGYLMGNGKYNFQQVMLNDDKTISFNGRLYGVDDPVIDCHV